MELSLKRYWNLLVQYLEPLKSRVLLLTALIFSGIALQLINPQIIRYFIDSAIAGGETRNLVFAAAMFLGASLLLQAIGVASTYVGEDVGWQATNAMREDLALHCLRLDMSFHNDRTPGEMIERIDGDIADIAIFFAQFVVKILGNLLLVVGVLLVLLAEDWHVSLALTIYVVIALIGLIYMRQVAVPHWKAAREASAELFGFIEEQLAGTEDIRSSGAVPYSMRNLFKFNKQRLEKETVAGVMNILVVMMWIGFYTLGQAIALVAGFYLFQDNVLTIGSVYLIIYYTDAIFRPLREITNEIQNLQKAAAGIDRVENLFALESIIPNSRIDRLPAGPLGVRFDDVSFEYAEGKRTLQELSFELLPGEVLGILGRTGSGKSTITRLLFRLYDPTTGAIRFGANGSAIDIRETSLDDLRNHVGMVTQDVQLFRASVRDNLTFFDKTFRDEQLLEVIEQLELSHWYDNLKDGLDTELETEGTSLSAGEGQLLAFTRVFLKNPGLVILDEASSRLDPATERYIERAVSKLLQNRTGIIVAHRLETVGRADKILILEAGRIQEFGKYDDLAKDKNSRFATLLKTGLREVLV